MPIRKIYNDDNSLSSNTFLHDMTQNTIIPTLYIFSGLPGVGKSTLAQKLASHIGAVFLRVDTVEQALRDLCHLRVQGEGYRLCYRIARDNLLIGSNVVADSCNPIELTRNEWVSVAKETNSRHVNIEIICSNLNEHRQRVETRIADISGLQLPSWDEIQKREYHPWSCVPITIDTAGKSIESCLQELLDAILMSSCPQQCATPDDAARRR